MAGYSTSNPPVLLVAPIAHGLPALWMYSSSDSNATVDTSGYITNGGDLGMKVGDLVFVRYTTTPIVKMHYVISVSSTAPGAVDLSDGTTVADGSSNTD